MKVSFEKKQLNIIINKNESLTVRKRDRLVLYIYTHTHVTTYTSETREGSISVLHT